MRIKVRQSVGNMDRKRDSSTMSPPQGELSDIRACMSVFSGQVHSKHATT